MDKIIGCHTRGLESLKEISLGQGQAGVERALTPKSRACVLHQLTSCPWAKSTLLYSFTDEGRTGSVVFISSKTM